MDQDRLVDSLKKNGFHTFTPIPDTVFPCCGATIYEIAHRFPIEPGLIVWCAICDVPSTIVPDGLRLSIQEDLEAYKTKYGPMGGSI